MLFSSMNLSLLSLLLLSPATYASPTPPTDLDDPQAPQILIGALSLPTDLTPTPSTNTTPLETTPTILGIHLVPREPAPQTTCAPNSGTDNTGCGNSGVANSGTGNSGVCLSGTGESGVGDCSNAAEAVATSVYVLASPTTVYLVQTVTLAGDTVITTVQSVFAAGATATQTIVVDDGRYNRPGCAYWRTQGYICSAAGKDYRVERWLFWPVVVGVVGLVAVL